MPAARSGIGGGRPRPAPRAVYHKGADSLADAELLAIQLGTDSPVASMDMARELLSRNGSLWGLAGCGLAELGGHPRVGPVKAVRLAATFEITGGLRSRNGHARVCWAVRNSLCRYGRCEDLKRRCYRVCPARRPERPVPRRVVSEGRSRQPGPPARGLQARPSWSRPRRSFSCTTTERRSDAQPERTCGSPDKLVECAERSTCASTIMSSWPGAVHQLGPRGLGEGAIHEDPGVGHVVLEGAGYRSLGSVLHRRLRVKEVARFPGRMVFFSAGTTTTIWP